MFWFLHLIYNMSSCYIEISNIEHFVFEGFKMKPIHLAILLGLVLNTLVDAAGLSAAYTHVFRQQTEENLTYVLSNIEGN